jgi:transcriptional regulator with XRE-family HTH domain
VTAINAKYFRSALADADKSQRDMARALGVDPSAIVMLLKGKRRIQLDEAQKISRLINRPIEEVLAAAGMQIHSSKAQVLPTPDRRMRLAGYVDENGRILPGDGDEISVPRFVPADAMVLVFRPAHGNWLAGALFIVRPSISIEPTAVGRCCWVKPSDGDSIIAHFDRGLTRDGWTLRTPTGDTHQAQVTAVSAVSLIIP